MTIEQELRIIPFNTLAQEYETVVKENKLDWTTHLSSKKNWLLDNNIKHIGQDWLYPKLMTHFSTFKLNKSSERDYGSNKIDCLQYLKDNLDFNDPWNKGLLLFMQIDKRSLTLQVQNRGSGLQYCSLVPLIMSAHKRYNDTPYSDWDFNTMMYIVNPSLLEALDWECAFELEEPEEDYCLNEWGIHSSELRKLRVEALTYKSGNKKGEVKDPKSTYTVNSTSHPIFASMPTLTRIMAIQTWAAHPDNRHKYMILSLSSWDDIPEELVTSDIFIEPKMPVKEEFPWD